MAEIIRNTYLFLQDLTFSFHVLETVAKCMPDDLIYRVSKFAEFNCQFSVINGSLCYLFVVHPSPSRRGGGYSLIWPTRGCTAGQGMVLGLFFPKQGIYFYVFVPNRERILSFVLDRDLKLRVLS